MPYKDAKNHRDYYRDYMRARRAGKKAAPKKAPAAPDGVATDELAKARAEIARLYAEIEKLKAKDGTRTGKAHDPSSNSKKLTKILARMMSGSEREASFSAACEHLKKHGRDWHDLVEAVEQADILADPAPDPAQTARQAHNRDSAIAVLKKHGGVLTKDQKAFLRQLIDSPSKHEAAAAHHTITAIIGAAIRAEREARKAARA